jgi:HSP20 family protein
MTRIPNWTWRRDLGAPLAALQEELGKLYDQYRTRLAGGEMSWVPEADLYETDTELTVVIDLPGVESTAIDLSVSGRTLILRGLRPSPDPALGRLRFQERYAGPFGRDLELPEDVDADGIQADFRNGILQVRLPKAAKARTFTIPVRTG